MTSYSASGTRVRATVVGALARDASAQLPPGTLVSGSVVKARPIGFGLRRERALLELRFDRCESGSGDVIPCRISLQAVDNARETVGPQGLITGILAASHPHSWFGGIWLRPGNAFSRRTAAGLTGTAGKLQSKIAPSPIGALLAMGSRLLLFRMPDAEIELPAGTQLILHIEPEVADGGSAPVAAPALPEAAVRELAAIDPVVAGGGGRKVGDIVNFVLFGSREQVDRIFAAAGWVAAEPMNRKTFTRTYAAFAAMKTYPAAPVSALYYDSRLPDVVYQKSFNSLSKRHHIRLWRTETSQGEAWLGAATHDIGAAFDWNRLSMTHAIDPRLDRERQTVLNDLRQTSCVEAVSFIERPALARPDAEPDKVATDGALAAVSLRECSGAPPQHAPFVAQQNVITTRIARRLILESRNYVTRGNPYYWLYRGVRWTVTPRSRAGAGDEVVSFR